jgi:hypothetical protein
MHCCKALCLTKCTSQKRRGGLFASISQKLIDLLTLAIRFLGKSAHATETRLDRSHRDNYL